MVWLPVPSTTLPLSLTTISCFIAASPLIVILLPPPLKLILDPATMLLSCRVLSLFCANIPSPNPKFSASLPSAVLNFVSKSIKFAFTLLKASRRSSPVPSFAMLPMLIDCIAIYISVMHL